MRGFRNPLNNPTRNHNQLNRILPPVIPGNSLSEPTHSCPQSDHRTDTSSDPSTESSTAGPTRPHATHSTLVNVVFAKTIFIHPHYRERRHPTGTGVHEGLQHLGHVEDMHRRERRIETAQRMADMPLRRAMASTDPRRLGFEPRRIHLPQRLIAALDVPLERLVPQTCRPLRSLPIRHPVPPLPCEGA